ncbi:acyl-CoA dehydrogenase family protein [Streptomyces sp. NBC_01408]|uniref:acyl-CoA dehydrogenase family protein n=1 Tax=Streptomyces sp. NBC_01408 TaxID=2903855 RepID=UPI00225538FA|nr:acyl-CoA dehydrogenase family protein [Streptomyces sp. NBC_01408]MCX4692904.1 acyl-CoA dehydrogenase family protein [Streptomyces sp. NBC_01408]
MTLPGPPPAGPVPVGAVPVGAVAAEPRAPRPEVLLDELLTRAAAPGGAFDPAELARLDEAEEFPAAAYRLLHEAGVPAQYVPCRHGGELRGLDGLMAVVRTVARRDLTVAIAHGKTSLGAMPLWVAGSPAQAAGLAAEILAGAEVCWGLTEAGSGSDLLAGRLTARPHARGGLRLDGAKWLINNATRARFACVLARTRSEGGPRGFGFVLVDKDTLPAETHRALPKERTHGIRGADISGIEFTGARVPETTLVGRADSGFEVVLKSLQLTRIFSTSLSLGAADHALPIAVRFLADRPLYGHQLGELPRVRRVLGEAAAAFLLAESVAVLSARAAQTLTGELSVLAAVTKAFVPTTVQRAVDALADLLGVRGFLTSHTEDGAFAKLDRDHRIVAVFDGSTAVNRHALITAFPLLARAHAAQARDEEGLAAAARIHGPQPELDPGLLSLISAGGCTAVQSLPQLARRAGERGREDITAAAHALAAESARLHQEIGARRESPGRASAAAFDLAQRYELCYAGAAALALWTHNTPGPGARWWREDLWVRACLTLVLSRLGLETPPGPDARDLLCDEILDGGLTEGEFSLLHGLGDR